METRTIEQIKVYALVLNPVTGRAEEGNPVAAAYDKQKLIDWYNEQFADEPYKDGKFHKVFKKNSHIEWYNPLNNVDEIDFFGQGIYYGWYEMDGLEESMAQTGTYIIN
ncbi:MAG: hypothetical protein ACOC33_02810 [bacterium]